MVEEEQRRLVELQNQLNDEKTSLEHSRQTLDQESKQLEGRSSDSRPRRSLDMTKS